MIAEVQQHLGDDRVRAVAMDSTDGLARGTVCLDTGGPISVPVGEATLGRLWNVTGDPIDEKGPVAEGVERWSIHRDPPIFRDLSPLPAALAFNSPEERELLMEVSGAAELPGEVVGVGIEDAPVVPPDEIRRRLDVLGDYVVYVGRIEREKGCARLFDEFARYVREQAPHLNLVLVGKAVLPVPVHVNFTHLGVLSETEKLSVVGASRLLVHPSPFESLSMALLEAWKMGRPALVNGRCSVLRGQVQRAGGGLYYGPYEEFAEALTWLLSHGREADTLGRSGRAYFERHYSWPVIMEKYERLLACASAS